MRFLSLTAESCLRLRILVFDEQYILASSIWGMGNLCTILFWVVCRILTPEETIRLESWLDEQYTEKEYPTLEKINDYVSVVAKPSDGSVLPVGRESGVRQL